MGNSLKKRRTKGHGRGCIDQVDKDVQNDKPGDKQSCSSYTSSQKENKETHVEKVQIEYLTTDHQHNITRSLHKETLPTEQGHAIASSHSLDQDAVQRGTLPFNNQHEIVSSCSLGVDDEIRENRSVEILSPTTQLTANRKIKLDKPELQGDLENWKQFNDFREHTELQLNTTILDELISQCVIIITDREEMEKPPSQRQRNDVLLDILKQRPFPTFGLFIAVLAKVEGNNPDVHDFALECQQPTLTKIGNVDKFDSLSQNVTDVVYELVKLHKNYRTIVEGIDTYTTEDILDHMLSDVVINYGDKEKISSNKPTHAMNRSVLSVMAQKGTKAIRYLHTILGKLHDDVSNKIQNTKVTEQDLIRVSQGIDEYKRRGALQNQRHIPENIRGQFEKITEEWIEEDELFVSTHAAEVVMAKIKVHNFVVATGNSGTGKTYTVRHTALVMEKEGYIIVPAVNPEDISKYYKHGCKTLFVFDDLCGRFTLNQNYLDQWKLHKPHLTTFLKDKCCKIIASCRAQVFNETKMNVFVSEIGGNECKINSSVIERRAMVNKYFDNKTSEMDDEKVCEFEFLPFLCSILKNKNILDIQKCFQNPFNFFKNELEILYNENDDGKRKCCALILCVLYNNTLTLNELKNRKEVLQSVLEDCELSSTESPKRIKTSLESLIGVYITYDNGTYKIIHDKLFDVIAKHYGHKMTDIFIKFADSGFLRERFFVKSRQTSNTTDFIEISEDNTQLFMERMVNDWTKGDVNNVFRNTNMKSKEFRQELLSFIATLDYSLQIELAQKRDNHYGDTPLYLLCFYGDLKFAKWIVDHGADVNLGRKDNSTPLQIACLEGYTDLVELLLQCKQINVNSSDVSGMTALLWACQEGNTALVKLLLKCEQIDINHSDGNNLTPLHRACQVGNVEIVTELLQRNVDLNREQNGWTPLMLACHGGYTDLVKLLMTCEQIDVNHSDINNITPLHRACQDGNVEIVTELLQRNADLNREQNGWTPIMLACHGGYNDLVKLLLKCEQINVNYSNVYGRTMLHVACQVGNVEMVTELLKHEHNDVDRLDSFGCSAFYLACHNENLELVKKLIEHGVDINKSAVYRSQIECDHGNKEKLDHFLRGRNDGEKYSKGTILDFDVFACQLVHYNVIRAIARCPREVFLCRKEGSFPLLEACDENQIDIVRELLRCPSIQLNQSNNYGQTALFGACLKGHIDVINELIKSGADVNKSDISQISPLHIACMARNKLMVKLLIDNGAKIDFKDNEGMTPLDIATEEDDRVIIEILQKERNIYLNIKNIL